MGSPRPGTVSYVPTIRISHSRTARSLIRRSSIASSPSCGMLSKYFRTSHFRNHPCRPASSRARRTAAS